MKKIIYLLKKAEKNERGIALLFTLGILSLMLVLALSFASSSMLERKASQYSNDSSFALQLAQSGMNRAVAAMNFHKTINANYSTIVSQETTGDNSKHYDRIFRVDTDLPSCVYKMEENSSGTAFQYDATESNAIHWIYVYNGYDTGSSKREIIGRFAYVCQPVGGRLDPSYTVDSGADGSAVNEVNSNTTGSAYYVPRLGVKPDEIYIGNLDPTNSTGYLPTSDISKLSSDNASPSTGKMTAGTAWGDYDTFFTAMDLLGGSLTNAQEAALADKRQYWMDEWFVVNTSKYNEAYWKDDNGDTKKETDPSGTYELFHRFNMARDDWNSGLGAGANSSAAVSVLMGTVDTPRMFKDSFSDNMGLEWFKNNASLPNATFADSETRTKQICANLLDYCDSDDIPTSDVSAASWSSGSVPAYTGNEKTPYINELGLTVSATATISSLGDTDSNGTPNYSIALTADAKVVGEVINMYGENLAGALELQILEGQLVMNITYSGGSTTETTDLAGKNLTFSTPVGASGYLGEMQVASFSASSWAGVGNVDTSSPSLTITGVTIRINKAMLVYAGNNVDYCKITSSAKSLSAGDFLAISSAGSQVKCGAIAYQVDDPRQNLNEGDWPEGIVSSDQASMNDAYDAAGTSGAVNGGVTCASVAEADGDQEGAGATPTTISTAYIRNDKVKSPWELGSIHRGKKWQTINLKKYTTKYTETDPGIGTYDEGDANLLDQIKMKSETETNGLVNLKTATPSVTYALVRGVPINDDYEGVDSTSPSGQIDDTQAETLKDSIKTYLVNNPPNNRGEIVSAGYMTSLTAMDNDAKQEALIGKIACITRVDNSNRYKVIVVAQSIKDSGVPYNNKGLPTNVPFYKDLNLDGTIEDEDEGDTFSLSNNDYKRLGLMDKDGCKFDCTMTLEETIEAEKGKYELGHDEITGEQKIIATVEYDSSTSKWKIINYEIAPQ